MGDKKLPSLAKGVGQVSKEFNKAAPDVQGELDRAMDDQNTYTPPPAPQITEQTSEQPESGDNKKDV